MGRLVRISDQRNDAERIAQERLSQILPPTWFVTTNIKEFSFQRNKREIDSLLICPLGLFVIDFKNHRGRITPQTNLAWNGTREEKKNPFSQGQDAVYTVKQHLQDAHREEEWWIEWLVVLTNPNAVLDWADSDCDQSLRSRVCLVDHVQDRVQRISQTIRFRPDARKAQMALAAFKPPDLSSHLSFIDENWPATSVSRPQPRISDPVPPPSASRPNPTAPIVNPDLARQKPPSSASREVWSPKIGYALGAGACAAVAVFALYKLTHCDSACEQSRWRKAERERIAKLPPPPPPLPFHSNVSAECKGVVEDRWEMNGQWRKLPGGGFREDGWANGHTNPCAIYFVVLEGTMGMGTDASIGIYSWHEASPARTQWPVKVDLVQSAQNAPTRWKVIFCREWHPVMKEWRCR